MIIFLEYVHTSIQDTCKKIVIYILRLVQGHQS